MNFKESDIYFLLKGTIIVLIVILPGFLHASKDTIPETFRAGFESNIAALNDLYWWNDSSFFMGDFILNETVDFPEELEGIAIFSDLTLNSIGFYNYLEGLDFSEKQHLIGGFSIFQSFLENELKEAGLPNELKYLAPTLSAMNTLAVGGKKQTGIWQLNHLQGVLNGLHISRLVDERFNERLATKAAAKQLKQNQDIFGNTELAVVAYLVGNTKLQNTITLCGSNLSLSEILKHLPTSITETIAAFQAMSVFLRINSFKPAMDLQVPDMVTVNKQVHFQQISQVLNIPVKQLCYLNPQFRYSIVPGDKRIISLAIPKGKHDDFVLWADSIYNVSDSTLFQLAAQKIEYPPSPNRQYVGEKVKDLEIEGKTKIKYTIKSGDVLGFIAEDYNVRVADLKYWNNIYNERRIQAGQKLDIFVDDENAEYYRNLQQTVAKKVEAPNRVAQLTETSPLSGYKISDSTKKVEHIVKSGESPYVIAKKYDGVTPEAILEWNGIKDARKIQIGQKLIIYLE